VLNARDKTESVLARYSLRYKKYVLEWAPKKVSEKDPSRQGKLYDNVNRSFDSPILQLHRIPSHYSTCKGKRCGNRETVQAGFLKPAQECLHTGAGC
jgi:hypothetical protein